MLRYVKSGFGGPPYLWRLLQTAQNGAWQPVSHAPKGYAGCLTAAPRISAIVTPQSRPSSQTRPPAPSCSSSPAVTLFASKKSVPRQPFASTRRRSEITRRSPQCGKSPCRSTGKANIQIVVRLRRAPASNKPSCKKRSALQNNHHRSSAEQTGAGQSVSDASQASHAADCRPSQSTSHKKVSHSRTAKSGRAFAPCKNEEIRKKRNHSKILIPNTQPSPGIRALLLQLPGCHAFCKKDCKKHARQPSASARRRSEVNRSSRNSGKSPCQCTGKANFNIVARASAKR